MREIKLRVWNYTEKKFIINEDVKTTIQMVEFFRYSTSAIMQQYTGLKDCNSKEIYEGDIIRFPYNGFFLKGEVVFDNGGFELKGVDYGEHFRLIEIVHLCEVIGNVFEDKEKLC